MSVIPLLKTGDHVTVVSSRDEFTRLGGFEGQALLITNIDQEQLKADDKESHLSYDLRVGPEYKDHREDQKRTLPDGEEIELLPGVAVILQTEENVCLPRSMFAYIIPRVKVMQKGLSNIVSKVDPGYDGPLVITVFNLGRRTITLKRREPICSLVVHSVREGARLYEKPAQLILGAAKKGKVRRFLDQIQANAGLVSVLAALLSALATLLALFKK